MVWTTIKDHLGSTSHCSRKEANHKKTEMPSAASRNRQVALSTMLKSKDAHFVKICTLAEIPLEEITKVRPFLRKYCAQAGALPQKYQLHFVYVPQLISQLWKCFYMANLWPFTAEEMTDVRIVNVIATVRGQPYLIDVVKWMLATTQLLVKLSFGL